MRQKNTHPAGQGGNRDARARGARDGGRGAGLELHGLGSGVREVEEGEKELPLSLEEKTKTTTRVRVSSDRGNVSDRGQAGTVVCGGVPIGRRTALMIVRRGRTELPGSVRFARSRRRSDERRRRARAHSKPIAAPVLSSSHHRTQRRQQHHPLPTNRSSSRKQSKRTQRERGDPSPSLSLPLSPRSIETREKER